MAGKIHIITPQKIKEPWLQAAVAEYIKRLGNVEFHFVKDDLRLIESVKKERHCIALDSGGAQMDSLAFADYLAAQMEVSCGRLAFVIGGAEGLPSPLKTLPLLSLSKMTFTHQIARLLLLEQIYRAREIARGSPYHK